MTLIPITEKTQICFVHCGKEICKCNPSKQINKMKTHEITTSKGEFVALRLDEGVVNLRIAKLGNVSFDNPDKGEYGYDLSEVPLGYKPICKLSEATEDDAKLVVDNPLYSHCSDCDECLITECKKHTNPYLDRLHSLLKSKGIDINNGNWYLFKKVL